MVSGIFLLWCSYYIYLILETLNEWPSQKLHKLPHWNYTNVFPISKRQQHLPVVKNNIKFQKSKGVSLFMDSKTDTGPVTLSLIFKRSMKGNVIITILQMKKLKVGKMRRFLQDHKSGNYWKEGRERRLPEWSTALTGWDMGLLAQLGQSWQRVRAGSPMQRYINHGKECRIYFKGKFAVEMF